MKKSQWLKNGVQSISNPLRNGPYKKERTTRQGMQKGTNFCATLLLLYPTSDWLNQQTLAKLQVAVHIFMHNLSTIFLSTKPLRVWIPK